MRKISLVMLICFVFNFYFICAEAKDFSAVLGEKEELLSTLNIIEKDIKLDKKVTKAEFCMYVVKLINQEKNAKSYVDANVFSDVSQKTKYGEYINFAYSINIVLGNGSGCFNPTDNITLSQCYTMVIRATGYEKLSQYNNNYSSLISKLGLNEDISKGGDEVAVIGDCIDLLFNALNVKYMDTYLYDGNLNLKTSEESILNAYFATYRDTGIVSAVNGISLTDKDYNGNAMIINGENFYIDLQNAKDYVGYNVSYYYTKNGNDKNIISIVKSKNQVITIEAKNLKVDDSMFAEDCIVYDEGTRKKQVNLHKYVNVVYNDEAFANYDINTFKINNGKIVIIDNNHDGKYDVVFVYEYENMIIKHLSGFSRKIVGLYGGELNLNECEYVIYGADNSYYEFLDMSVDDVLSVYKTKSNKKATIYVTNDKLYGDVEKISYSNPVTVKVGGNIYSIDKSYLNNNSQDLGFDLTHKGGFYLDVNKNIVAPIDNKETMFSYGYIVGAYLSKNYEIDNKAQIRIYNEKGEFQELDLYKNVLWDDEGVSQKPPEVISAILSAGTYTLIRYKLNNNGLLTNIALPKENISGSYNDKFTKDAELKNAEYRDDIFVSKYLIDSKSTVIFGIPNLKKGVIEKDFTVGNLFVVNDKYDIDIYDLDETLSARVIVAKPLEGSADYKIYSMVVDKVASCVNEEGDPVKVLYGYREGLYTKYICDLDEDKVDVDGFECGDVIQVAFNSKNRLTNVRYLIKLSDKHKMFEKALDGDYSGARLYVQYGICDVNRNGKIVVSCDNGVTLRPNYARSAYVYIYDSVQNTVKVATLGDIIPSTSVGAFNGDKVFVNKRWDSVKDIVVIR